MAPVAVAVTGEDLMASALAAAGGSSAPMDAVERVETPEPAVETPTKPPKAVLKMRNALGGKPVTVENMRAAVSPKEFNAFSNNFRNQLQGQEKVQWQGMAKPAREQWMAQWVLEPELCKKSGFNKTIASTDNRKTLADQWVLESELGGPRFLNSADHAKKIIESGDLQSRPSRFAALAAAGVCEYLLTTELVEYVKGLRKEAGVECSSDLKTDEYNYVLEGLDNSFDKPPRPVKKAKVTKPVEQWQKDLKDLNAKKGLAFRTLKKNMDTVESYVQSLAQIMPKLEQKGYPQALQDFYSLKMASLKEVCEQAKRFYGERVVHPEAKEQTQMDHLKAMIQEVEDQNLYLLTAKQTFEKDYGNDMKKIGA